MYAIPSRNKCANLSLYICGCICGHYAGTTAANLNYRFSDTTFIRVSSEKFRRRGVIPQSIAGRFRRAAASSLVLLALATSTAAQAAPTRSEITDAASAVAGLGDRAFGILRETSPASASRHWLIHDLIAEKFDMPVIAQYVAGRAWPAATEAERDRFIAAFGHYATELLSERFSRYTKQAFAIVGQRAEADGSSTISTEITESNATPGVKVDWRVANQLDQYKITDVMVSGVSIARTKRAEFGTIIERNGGRISAITTMLEDKTAHWTQSAAKAD